LRENYPNPFNPSTTIRYSIPATSKVTFTIFDLLGREVLSIHRGVEPAGEHSVDIHMDANPSGIYFYRLQAGDRTAIRKMLLIR